MWMKMYYDERSNVYSLYGAIEYAISDPVGGMWVAAEVGKACDVMVFYYHVTDTPTIGYYLGRIDCDGESESAQIIELIVENERRGSR